MIMYIFIKEKLVKKFNQSGVVLWWSTNPHSG